MVETIIVMEVFNNKIVVLSEMNITVFDTRI
jgi:hypothetical protein